MELISLSLTNFRPFQEAHFEFARGDKGVTVIHGPNGSGKTTILKAFPWILYGDVAFDTGIEGLPNEGAIAQAAVNDRVRVSGELVFTHEDERYTATRWAEFRKADDDEIEVAFEDTGVQLIAHNGTSTKEINNPEVRLQQILPSRLSSLFFFDGEDIEALANPENDDKIQEAIQNIMGLTILERSIDHLKTVEDKFEDRMEKYGSDELQDLIEKKRNLNTTIEEMEQKVNVREQNISQLKSEIEDIKAKLEELEDSRDYEQQRSRLQDRRKEIEERIAEINDDIRTVINNSAYLEFAMPAVRETAQELDDLRAKGEIPSELSNEFVDRLLDKEECICARPIKPGTEAYLAVESWKSDTTVEGIDQAAMRLIAQLEQIADSRSDLFDELDDLIATRSDLLDEVDELTELIDELGSKIEDIESNRDHEDPATLEKRRKEKETEQQELREEIIGLEHEIEQKEEQRDKVEREIDEAEEQQAKARTARRRKQAARAVREELESSFADLQSTVRTWSNELVKETFDDIARKDLQAEITDKFKLIIRQQVGDDWLEMHKSTGERQIASLAFIGSLASIARERYHSNKDSPYFTGGIYPVVMDSPFGALDKGHRRQVSHLMPQLADQVIVLATDSQWEGPVESEMADYVGQQYWLNYDNEDYPITRVQYESPSLTGGDSQ